jgi:hypothetical protein
MRRTEAYVGQEVRVGGGKDPSAYRRGVVVELDCGDNGYRIGIAALQKDGSTWLYGMWPLHSVHTASEYEAQLAKAQEAIEARAWAEIRWRDDLDEARRIARELEERGVVVVVIPDMRTGEHKLQISGAESMRRVGALL